MLALVDRALGTDSSVYWSVESPVHGVLNIDVVVGGRIDGAPLHFRIGDWSKPPLDLAIGVDGAISSLQVVLQEEIVPPVEETLVSEVPVVGVRFDVSRWPIDRYRDERSEVVVGRAPDGVLVVSLGTLRPDHHRRVGEGLVLGFDSDQLAEVRVGPLAAAEWKMIEESATPRPGASSR